MSINAINVRRILLLSNSALVSLSCVIGDLRAQEAPGSDVTIDKPVVVTTQSRIQRRPAVRRPVAQTPRRTPPTTRTSAPAQTPQSGGTQQVAAKNNAFDTARTNLLTTSGTTSYPISHEAIQDMPEGANAPIERVGDRKSVV